MKTIVPRRNKQNGKEKIISKIVKPLGQYTFECGRILLNSLIRNSVLYGSKGMYNITENKIGEIERIEEKQMKNICQEKTGIQVPLHIMYLDGGHISPDSPIMQYIIQHDEKSLLYQMVDAKKKPIEGNWFSECNKLLEEFDINL